MAHGWAIPGQGLWGRDRGRNRRVAGSDNTPWKLGFDRFRRRPYPPQPDVRVPRAPLVIGLETREDRQRHASVDKFTYGLILSIFRSWCLSSSREFLALLNHRSMAPRLL